MWYVDPSDKTGRKSTRLPGTPANKLINLISFGMVSITAGFFYALFRYQTNYITEEEIENFKSSYIKDPVQQSMWLTVQSSYYAIKYKQRQAELDARLKALDAELENKS